jgi:AraC-like DNA-binding protein
VARELRMSARQLQRKLSEASTSFSALQDDARKTLAPSMLATDGANVEQVAFSLGFADPTAFIRAFKRWFGVTPGTFQRTKR